MSIEIIHQKGGKKYRVCVYLNGKRCRSQLFNRMVDATLWEEKVVSGYTVDRIPTFKTAAEEWLNSHSILHNKPSTILKNRTLLKELIPLLGNRTLAQIKTRDIEEHLRGLVQKGLSKSSLTHRIALLKSVYNWHMKRGIQVFNPCLAIRPFKDESAPVEHWTLEQAEQFLAYTDGKYTGHQFWIHLLYLIALNTGLRWGEIIGLDWSVVDLPQRRVCISQTFDEKVGQIRPSTKSGRIRYVGINDALYESLAEIKGAKTSGLIFRNLASQPLDRRNFRARHFVPDMEAAAIPRIRFHALRHTYASIYMSNGGNIYDLQKLLGHSTLSMTDRYAHFSPDHVSQRANVVNVGIRLRVIEGGRGEVKKIVG